ncbi:E3 ubiquitin-protein ligase tom1, partial [Teratosphaeriaceae sp. CCFEE 6253]
MDEDDDDDEDDEDDEHFQDHIDEITGDDENASLADGDEGEWEEEDGEFDEDGNDGLSPHGGPLDHIARVIGADEPSEGDEHEPGHLVRLDMGDGPEDYFEDEMPPEDEDGTSLGAYRATPANSPTEEDEEVDYEDDVAYEPEIE